MSAPPPASTRSRQNFWSLAIPAAVALAYALGHLMWYRETPLGQVPVMDEQENLALAEAIARGVLPREPFYRAPGYAVLLAGLRGVGVPTASLFHAALLLGAVLHAVNAVIVASITRAWFPGAAALIAGVLYALHPVFVHYGTQALDATPALTFFLAGLCFIAPEISRQKNAPPMAWRWAAASVLWAAATITRPNYLLVWCVLPVLAIGLFRMGARWRCLAAACAGAVVFGSVALWQWRVSGDAGFLPWQGPYNLWAANEPGAHGRYYVQKHSLPAAVAKQNPARAESIYFYRMEKGVAPLDIAALNAHWRARFIEHVTQRPVAWLGQLARKAYALLNNWEQYNNKTFAFHQARSPWLRWNPLCWGVLFVLGVAGIARLASTTPRAAAALAAIVTVCAASIVLFFVSARFRLPLAAFAAILAGGVLAAPGFWRTWPRRRQIALAAALAVAAGLVFSSFDRVRDRATFVQDHALLARAASTVGDDAVAWTEARAALELQPRHPDALRIAVAAYFNGLVIDHPPFATEKEWLDVCAKLLAEPVNDIPDLRAVASVALWRAGERSAALAEWRNLGGTPSAVAARLLIGDLSPARVAFDSWPRAAWDEPLVRLAALRLNISAPGGLSLGDAKRAVELVDRLFATAAVRTAK